MAGPREWNARSYDRVSSPQLQWSAAVIDRLGLRGDERVLDAGCGSGRVTEQVLERLPRGELVGVDGSEAMVAAAHERLDRIELVHSDLLEFEPDRCFDAVFSNATFHWIADHERLFARIAGWLRPGGRLEAQCGGQGNVAAFLALAGSVAARAPYVEHLDDPVSSHYFAGAAETERRLEAAGFSDVSCSLDPQPTRTNDLEEFLEVVCLREYLDVLPGELRERFVAEVAAELGPDPVLDYVRLNISARR